MKEAQFVKKICSIFLNEDPQSKISYEVPILGRYADLAFIKKKKIITIECKLYDWRRALQQTIDHKLGADYSYICMPERVVTDLMVSEIRKFGIGLYLYSDKKSSQFIEIIRAKKSEEIYSIAWHNTYKYILNNRSKVNRKINAVR